MRSRGRFWTHHLVALAIIALTSTTVAAADLSIDDILGRWCGAVSDYTFTRTQLIIRLHKGEGKYNVLDIVKVNVNAEWLDVEWKSGGNTVFEKFSADKRQMFQAANTGGDMGPVRKFQRC